MPQTFHIHDEDPATKLTKDVGDISTLSLFSNQVLVAVYVRPSKTKSGIILPGQTVDEDKYQGKVGLILKTGPSAFVDPDGKWFPDGAPVAVGDWVFFKPSSGWSVTINRQICRVFDDINIIGKIESPDEIW